MASYSGTDRKNAHLARPRRVEGQVTAEFAAVTTGAGQPDGSGHDQHN